MYTRLRCSVVVGVALQQIAVEKAFAKVLVGLVVGDGTLLGFAIGKRLALALHPDCE